MKEVYLLNSSLEVLAILDDYYSLNWAERYNEFGDFELVLPIEYITSTNIIFSNFLYISGSDKVMVIEDMKPQYEEEESSLVINGRSAESLLDRRVLLYPLNVDDIAEQIIYDLIDKHVTNPDDTNRTISSFKTTFPTVSTSETFSNQIEMQDIYSAVEFVAKSTGLGFKIERETSPSLKLAFSVYKGEDRSFDQSTNPYVIFSDDFDNVIKSSYYESEVDKLNIVLVATNDEQEDLQKVFVWEGTEPTGISRHEGFFETSIERIIDEPPSTSSPRKIKHPTLGITTSDNLAAIGITVTPEVGAYYGPPQPPLSDAEVLAIINTRGKQVIEENKTVGLFEGDFDIQGNFKYGTDFFMGDIVQCNLGGKNVKARIIELVSSYTTEGEKSYVAMDFII